jgi:EF-hand domain pair/EF hand
MVSQVGSSVGFSAPLQSGAQCRGPRDTQALQEKLFAKLDVNGDGGIDQSELGDFLSYAASSSGGTSQVDSAQLVKSLDSNGDGAISKSELADGVKSLFDALRSQLTASGAAAGARPAGKSDPAELFAKIDSNGDGAIDKDELGAFMEANRPPPPHGGGLLGKIESLLDQYRSTATEATSDTAGVTLAVAA